MTLLKRTFRSTQIFILIFCIMCSIFSTQAQDDLYGSDMPKKSKKTTTNYTDNSNATRYNTYDYNTNNQQPYYGNNATSDQVPYANAPAYPNNNTNAPYNYASNNADDNQNFEPETVTTTYYPNYSVFNSPWFYPSLGLGFGWGSYYNNIAFNWGLGFGFGGGGYYGGYGGWGPWGYPYYPSYYYRPYYRPYYGGGYSSPRYYSNRPVINNGRPVYSPNTSTYRRATIYNNASGSTNYNRSTYNYRNSNVNTNTNNNTNYNNQNYNNSNFNRPSYNSSPSYNRGGGNGGGFSGGGSGGGSFRGGGGGGGFRR